MDLCDNERHFARIVPQRAADCPSLFNAILCVSAKRLSKIDDYDSRIADQYHQECLEFLIPAVYDPAAALDENLLATIVLLRYMEEVDVPISGEATESHLLGTRAFIAAQISMDLTGLRLAAFLLAVRQEIYMGFVHNRTVDSSFFLIDLDSLLHPGDSDCGYANRIIFHCLTCLRYCYGPGERRIAQWNELNDRLDTWWRNKPKCFEALWVNWCDESFFPEIWYLSDAVITGIQHYHLARVLMAAHSPTIPRLGPAHTRASRALEDDIKQTVRQVCGVAVVSVTE
ncbi:Fc.00g071420.m01.CDS01 [Cosmosporella sp. VM-42]